ncbi:MAG: ABC transporter permease, partial [Gemmatimonadota bacterium]
MQVELEVGPESRVADPRSNGRRSLPARWLGSIGRSAEGLAQHAGQLAMILWGSATALVRGQISLRQVLREMYTMGVQTLPIVLVTGVLSGVVTSQQGGYQFTGSVPLYVVGSVVVSSVILELGPVLTAVVFIGRVGARITAELGT